MSRRVSGTSIREHILRTLHLNQLFTISKTAKRFGIPKKQAEQHAEQLVKEGRLRRTTSGYELVGRTYSFANKIAEKDIEHEVYLERIQPIIDRLPDNVQRICYYGFSEIYNNAVDHSAGSNVHVELCMYDYSLEISIRDDGVGIFDKIKTAFGLDDYRQVLIELAKGGLTTDPSRHSGQGIFFTSRAFDRFVIMSKRTAFFHADDRDADWLLEDGSEYKGTVVIMNISKHSNRNLKDLFDKYTTNKEEMTVFKTHAPLKLASLASGDFVSRSQAKRVLAKFDKYQEIFIDFQGVEFIGQAFADEIFRVFKLMNPGVELIYIRANENVTSMIEFAKRTVPSGPVEASQEI